MGGTPQTDRNLYVTHAAEDGAGSDALGTAWTGGSFTVRGPAAPAGMPALRCHAPGRPYFVDPAGKGGLPGGGA